MVSGAHFQAENYQAFVQVLKKIRNYFNQMKKQDSAIHKSMKLFVIYDQEEEDEERSAAVSGAEKSLVELCEK